MDDETDDPTDDALERPQWACRLCPPPRGHRAWTQADPGFVTCSGCYDRLRARLKEVAARYVQLSPAPGGTGEYGTRGAPGFGSRPPANVSVISMRDPRSSPVARVWLAADGRVHAEDERPPLSVQSVLNGVAWAVAEHRGVDGPADDLDVYALLRWIDRHVDHVTRHEPLTAELDGALRTLLAQLRPVTGDARKRIGDCPNVLDEGAHSRECGAPLFAPLAGSDTIRCTVCGRFWARDEWLHLGDLLAEVDRSE